MRQFFYLVAAFFLTAGSNLSAWHDNTHIAIGLKAAYDKAYLLPAPDIAKLKAGEMESYNHWYNAELKETISVEMIKNQISLYNFSAKKYGKGHLYGAIIASLRDYLALSPFHKGKYGYYHLVFVGHYIGDLSMPFHNIVFSGYAKYHHAVNDAILDEEVLQNLDKIQLYEIIIKNETDLMLEIAKIANLSKKLGYELQEQQRNMTRQEAYNQIAHSASLMKAVLKYISEQPSVKN